MLPLYLSPKRLVRDRNEAFRKISSEDIAKLQISKMAADSKVKRPLTHEIHSSLYILQYQLTLFLLTAEFGAALVARGAGEMAAATSVHGRPERRHQAFTAAEQGGHVLHRDDGWVPL